MNILTPFKDLIPPLTQDEFKQLEQNILADGIRHPLVLWGAYLIDGHNRYKIAQKHGLEYQTVEMNFDDESAAKIWIITNQLGRRNIEKYVRAELILDLEPLIKAQAKDRQKGGQGGVLLPQNSAEPNKGDTRDQLAAKAGVSHDTIDKTKYIKKHGSEELKEKIRSGKVSINKAYHQTKDTQEGKAKPTTKPFIPPAIKEKTCTVCGRVLPVESFYFNNGSPIGPCKQCERAKRSFGISPTIREDIGTIQEASDYLTDKERVIEYSIEDVVATITSEFTRIIRITETEIANHEDLLIDPANKDVLVKALEHGVSQIQSKIKDLAR